jgi:hypothetical protein
VTIATFPSSEPIGPPENDELFYYIGYSMVIVFTDQGGDTYYPSGVPGRAPLRSE